jgi:membrane-associated protease RseP (regulator of RpoE activity)
VRVFADLADLVATRPGAEVTIRYERDGQLREARTVIGEREDGRGLLGVSQGFAAERFGPVEAVPAAVADFGTLTTETVKGMGRVFSPSGMSDYMSHLFSAGREEPAASGPAASNGEEGGRVISIYGATLLGAGALDRGLDTFLLFLAMLNVFIGLFNLVPLLPLDGGHIAIATYERIREVGRGGRRYYVDINRLLPLTYAVVTLLVFIGGSALFLDLVDPIRMP